MQSPLGIAYHETSVLIPLSTEEVHFMEQPVLNQHFPSHLSHLLQLGLASFLHGFLMFTVFLYFVTFCSVGWLVVTPCLSLHGLLRDLLFALGGTLLVARGSPPLRQLGLHAP